MSRQALEQAIRDRWPDATLVLPREGGRRAAFFRPTHRGPLAWWQGMPDAYGVGVLDMEGGR